MRRSIAQHKERWRPGTNITCPIATHIGREGAFKMAYYISPGSSRCACTFRANPALTFASRDPGLPYICSWETSRSRWAHNRVPSSAPAVSTIRDGLSLPAEGMELGSRTETASRQRSHKFFSSPTNYGEVCRKHPSPPVVLHSPRFVGAIIAARSAEMLLRRNRAEHQGNL